VLCSLALVRLHACERYNGDAHRFSAMDPKLTTAIVSACATALVVIVALMQNSKRIQRLDDHQ
jgi:hypothetical protein